MVSHFQLNIHNPKRGFHLITDDVLGEIDALPENGILNLFVQHTSAGLTINENADYSVRDDFETVFNKLVPEDQPYYTHTYEGSDDMPAHIKSALTNNQISLSVKNSKLILGTWQGIYLFEHRLKDHKRTIVHHYIGN